MINAPCIPETKETLHIQQLQLIRGKRRAQLFPLGTPELGLPKRMERFVTRDGICHYDPDRLFEQEIMEVIDRRAWNLILNLGPTSKNDVYQLDPNPQFAIVERTPGGTEVRAAITCRETFSKQWKYFISTKEEGCLLRLEPIATVLLLRSQGRGATHEDNTSPTPEQAEYLSSVVADPTPAKPGPAASSGPNYEEPQS